ncbi:cytochrome P450 [Aspergillus sclerotioniger CBS 115572]|uniref:Cytochrome P450 n=1 Tax=Aspergillus sclerotioniger CBS 115572 TaxID=1450535 RepID=A0A317WBC5_9EURO|nr:cytochrome P450 [Aspergillus sclerotioniger CBS 115572]PWY83643.1 cytochrome P450 [Aspergillus sclerotioniger CBS 115572]
MAFFNLLLTLGFTLLGTLFYGMQATYRHRCQINRLRKRGVPMPAEWNWITGHLLVLKKYVDCLPPDANVALATKELAFEFSDTEIFLMDFWPVYPPLWMVFSPEAAQQISTTYNLPKSDIVQQFMQPITGGPNLVSMSDKEWKIWRSIFNPGFSAGNMMDLLPEVIDSVQIFCDQLRERTNSGVFCLDDLTTRLTMDVILKVVLDMDLDYQRSDNMLATALGYITRWHSFWDPRVLANPLRPIIQRFYGRVLNRLIGQELEMRFVEMRKAHLSPNTTTKRAKSVIMLAVEAYMTHFDKSLAESITLDKHFSRYATYQIRLFLFAGNDTTSSSIVYVYHLLSQHPEAMRRVRQEHDEVFGPDPNEAARTLREQPALLNRCAYTMAVIRETLRLFPPAGTNRKGRRGVSLTDRDGGRYPTDYVGATILHTAMHLNPRVWPRPTEFLPQRWLVEPGHELYPDPAAYRPFEQGPRSCIGQTLVYNEMRLTLIMTARSFRIQPAYDEWDMAHTASATPLGRLGRWLGVMGPMSRTVAGERAYQTEKAGTHPADGYPCRVSTVA